MMKANLIVCNQLEAASSHLFFKQISSVSAKRLEAASTLEPLLNHPQEIAKNLLHIFNTL